MGKIITFYKRKLKRYRKFKPQDQNRYRVEVPSRGTSYQKSSETHFTRLKDSGYFTGILVASI
jgi:hypothetical protein